MAVMEGRLIGMEINLAAVGRNFLAALEEMARMERLLLDGNRIEPLKIKF